MSVFAEKDVVQFLVDGGPLMLVEYVRSSVLPTSNVPEEVTCVWFTRDWRLQRATLKASLLVRADYKKESA